VVQFKGAGWAVGPLIREGRFSAIVDHGHSRKSSGSSSGGGANGQMLPGPEELLFGVVLEPEGGASAQSLPQDLATTRPPETGPYWVLANHHQLSCLVVAGQERLFYQLDHRSSRTEKGRFTVDLNRGLVQYGNCTYRFNRLQGRAARLVVAWKDTGARTGGASRRRQVKVTARDFWAVPSLSRSQARPERRSGLSMSLEIAG
jgi:hypothetical protein